MLPRVSAALAQFISPIAVSGKQSVSSHKGFEHFAQPQTGKKREQAREEPKQEQQLSQAKAKIIPFPVKDAVQATSPPPSATSIPSGITQALLQLMNLFHEQGSTVRRWIGTGAYQLAARQQKKSGRIRKGTILDEKAE